MTRVEKLALLRRILSGQDSRKDLDKLRSQIGRLYTEQERAEQKAFMNTFCDKEHSDEEVKRFFGIREGRPGDTAYVLPNGMSLFFPY